MNYTLRKGAVCPSTERVLLLKRPFSEDDILTMNEALLTPGVHYIGVSDILEGRLIIKTFLNTLNYYHAVGCITLSPLGVPKGVGDIIQELAEHNILTNASMISNYIATQFEYECVWIESDKNLFHETWFKRFFDELTQAHMMVPVVVFMYV